MSAKLFIILVLTRYRSTYWLVQCSCFVCSIF